MKFRMTENDNQTTRFTVPRYIMIFGNDNRSTFLFGDKEKKEEITQQVKNATGDSFNLFDLLLIEVPLGMRLKWAKQVVKKLDGNNFISGDLGLHIDDIPFVPPIIIKTPEELKLYLKSNYSVRDI